MDFDPRWDDDPRDRDDDGRELSRGSRGGLSNPRERERLEPRVVFTRDLDFPRGHDRQRVWARDSDVRLRGSEVRTLATVGAFRVVPAGDLRDGQDRPLDPNRGDLRHLRDQGLVETIPTIGEDRALVVLTERGRDVLERDRWSNVQRELQRLVGEEQRFDDRREVDDQRQRPQEPKREQEFYAGVGSARVLTLEEETKLLDALHPRFQRFVRFALGTGCRLDEIRGIDAKQDIDWIRGTVHVIGKFRKERDVPMQPDASSALKEQLEAEDKLWKQNPQRLREVLAEGAERAKISTITPHALRHTFGTRWLQAAVTSTSCRRSSATRASPSQRRITRTF